MDKADFIFYYYMAREKAFLCRIICQSWKVAGLKHQNYQEVLDEPNIINHTKNEKQQEKVILAGDQTYVYESPVKRDKIKEFKEFLFSSEKNLNLGIDLLIVSLILAKAKCVLYEQMLYESNMTLKHQKEEHSRKTSGAIKSSNGNDSIRSLVFNDIEKILENILNRNFEKEQAETKKELKKIKGYYWKEKLLIFFMNLIKGTRKTFFEYICVDKLVFIFVFRENFFWSNCTFRRIMRSYCNIKEIHLKLSYYNISR